VSASEVDEYGLNRTCYEVNATEVFGGATGGALTPLTEDVVMLRTSEVLPAGQGYGEREAGIYIALRKAVTDRDGWSPLQVGTGDVSLDYVNDEETLVSLTYVAERSGEIDANVALLSIEDAVVHVHGWKDGNVVGTSVPLPCAQPLVGRPVIALLDSEKGELVVTCPIDVHEVDVVVLSLSKLSVAYRTRLLLPFNARAERHDAEARRDEGDLFVSLVVHRWISDEARDDYETDKVEPFDLFRFTVNVARAQDEEVSLRKVEPVAGDFGRGDIQTFFSLTSPKLSYAPSHGTLRVCSDYYDQECADKMFFACAGRDADGDTATEVTNQPPTEGAEVYAPGVRFSSAGAHVLGHSTDEPLVLFVCTDTGYTGCERREHALPDSPGHLTLRPDASWSLVHYNTSAGLLCAHSFSLPPSPLDGKSTCRLVESTVGDRSVALSLSLSQLVTAFVTVALLGELAC
jgi:hypothetical protein